MTSGVACPSHCDTTFSGIPGGGQPVAGRTVLEAMGPSPLAPGPGRLLIQSGMLDASPQMLQDRLPGQTDNDITRPVGRGPVGEQDGQVWMQQDGPALPPLPRRTSRVPAARSMSRHSRATVSPTRSPARHIMSAATRARRRPKAAGASRIRSTCWGSSSEESSYGNFYTKKFPFEQIDPALPATARTWGQGT